MWAGELGPSFRDKGSPLLFFRYEAGAQPSLPWYLGGGGRMLVRWFCQAHVKKPHAYCESHFRAQMAGTKGSQVPGARGWHTSCCLLAKPKPSELGIQGLSNLASVCLPASSLTASPCPTHPTRPAAS